MLVGILPAFLSGSHAQGAKLCLNYLTRLPIQWSSLQTVDVSGAVGLRVLSDSSVASKSYEQHELDSSIKYARMIFEEKGETLLLLTSYQGRSTPGFDGVIFSREGKAIANYSLKTLISGRAPHTKAMKTTTDVRKWSSLQGEWRSFLDYHVEQSPDGHKFSNQEKINEFKTWFETVTQYFGIESQGPRRGARIVIDLGVNALLPMPLELRRIRDQLTLYYYDIQSVTFLNDEYVLEVTPFKIIKRRR